MKKQIFAMLCTGLMTVSLCSCGSNDGGSGIFVEQNGEMIELGQNYVDLRDSIPDTKIEETVVLNDESVEIKITGCSYDENSNKMSLLFSASNLIDKDLIVESNGVYVNNCYVTGSCYREILGGHTDEFSVDISLYELYSMGFDSVGTIGVSFRVKEADSGTLIKYMDYVTVDTSEFDKKLSPVTFGETPVTVNQGGVLTADVQSRYTPNDIYYGNSIQVLVSNTSQSAMIELGQMKVNGIELPFSEFGFVEKGKQAVVSLGLFDTYLQEAGITDVNSITAVVRITGDDSVITQDLTFTVE